MFAFTLTGFSLLGSIKLVTGNGVEALRRGVVVSSPLNLLLEGTPRSNGCVCSGTDGDPLTNEGWNLGLGLNLLWSK